MFPNSLCNQSTAEEKRCAGRDASLDERQFCSARADDTATLSITMKDRQFDPAELHAPAGKPIAIHVKNLNPIVTEFESSELHFEKIVPPGNEGVVYVRPQQPGRYNFYDDFHHETQGALVVQ